MVIDPVASPATQPTYGNGLMPNLNGWSAYAAALPSGSNTIRSGIARTHANDAENDGGKTQCSGKPLEKSGVDTD
jgi:hypothetical protein